MGLNGGNMGLGFTLTLRDMMSGALNKIERACQSLDKTIDAGSGRMLGHFAKLSTAAGVLGASLAPLGASFAAAYHAGDFVQGLAAVAGATGATAVQMHALHDAAVQASLATQYTPTQAVGGLTSLATAGQTAAQAMETLRPSLDLATASLGELGVTQAAEAIVGTLNSYAFGVDKAREVTDKLVHATMVTNFQMRDFSAGLARAAEAGSLYQQSLDDILIGMGLLRNRNIAADVASTALRNSLIRVNSDVRSQNMMLRAGVPLRDQYTGQLRSILDVMTEFAAKTRHLDPLALNTMVKEIFGEEGMPAFSAIMNATFTSIERGQSVTHRGAQAIAAMRRELTQSAGAAERFVAQLDNNFMGQLKGLGGSISALGTVIGEVFGELLHPWVASLRRGIGKLAEALNAVPMAIKKVTSGFVLAAFGALTLGGAIFATARAFSLLKIAAVAASRVLVVPLTGLLAVSGPVLAGIAAVVAAVGALAAAYRFNLGGMADSTTHAWASMTLYWKGLRQVMDTGALRGDVLQGLNADGSQSLKKSVIDSYQLLRALSGLWQGIQAGFAQVGQMLAPYFKALSDAWVDLKSQLSEIFAALLPDDMRDLFDGFMLAGKLIGGVFAVIAASVAGLASAIVKVLADTVRVVKWVVKGLSAVFQSSLDTRAAKLASILGRTLSVATTRGEQSVAPARTTFWHNAGGLDAVLRAPGTPDVSKLIAQSPAAPPLAQRLSAPPAAAEVRARSQVAMAASPAASHIPTAQPERPISLAVQIDGETVARAVSKAKRQIHARSFEPLMGY